MPEVVWMYNELNKKASKHAFQSYFIVVPECGTILSWFGKTNLAHDEKELKRRKACKHCLNIIKALNY